MILLIFISASMVFLTITCGSAEEMEFNFEKGRNRKFCGKGPHTTATTKPPNNIMMRLFELGANDDHPAPLPTTKMNYELMIKSPYRKIYHGKRVIGDTRVYNKRFEYDAAKQGQHVFFKEFFTCTITQVIAESDEGVPIILQGGGSYNYFMVIFKSKAGVPLKGRLRAYCKLEEKDQDKVLRYQDIYLNK